MGQEEQQEVTVVTELLLGVVAMELLQEEAMELLQEVAMELLQEVVMQHKEVLQATHHLGPTR